MFSCDRRWKFMLLVGATCALLLNLACNYSEEGRAKEAPASSNSNRVIGAAGSTFIAPLMEQWAKTYGQAHPVQVNYQAVGSGAGIDYVKQGRLDFAASDAPLSETS